MVEKFFAGIQYLCTIVATASVESKLSALEQAFLSFKPYGVYAGIADAHAFIECPSISIVSIDVYVDLATRPQKFSPPPITRQTADAYERLIQTIMEIGCIDIKKFRDLRRTGLRDHNETPLFEVVDVK